jgi:hypothetical protein
MAPKARARVHRRSPGGEVGHSREFLERLARILVRCGHSPRTLVREFREVCSRLIEPKRRWDSRQPASFVDFPHVMGHWHTDPQYLDSRGRPIPLPLRGKGPSLYGLIEMVLPREDPGVVAQTLLRLKGIHRQAGFYLPTGRQVWYRQNHARVHALNSLLGMLRTIEHNVGGAKGAAILERAVTNPNFPVSELPAFHGRLNAQVTELLWGLDRDMRRCEAAGGSGPRTRLGVGIFAFDAPLLEISPPGARKAARRRVGPAGVRTRRRRRKT